MRQNGPVHKDEVVTDAALVRRLLADQFLEWAALPIEPVASSGTDNALYRLGDDMVVRLPRRRLPDTALEKECRWLPRIARLLPVAVPVLLGRGRPAEGYPFGWAVYRWLPGETAIAGRVSDQSRFASDLAYFIASLQRIDPTGGPPPGEHNFHRGEPLERRDAATLAAIRSLGGEIDVNAVTAVWKEALDAGERLSPPVWIHGDLDARNMLVKNGRLSAVIDFGGLAVGDPACDIMVAWKLLSPSARDVFLAALEVDEATWARGRGWALSQALLVLVHYTLDTNPVLVHEARRWVAATLA